MSASPDAGQGLDEDLRTGFGELVASATERGQGDLFRTHVRAALGALEPVAPNTGGAATASVKTFGMIGSSKPMLAVYELISKVAPTNVPVLIQGETGSGKELVAKAIHATSSRAKERLLAENCAAVPENLLESELFGHKKGAFTGAVQDRPGHFVAAHKGTVFLDEIGDMPLPMQAKLLRVLQDGEVRPVGSNTSRKVDVRLVAATHKDLPKAVRDGEFREDLLFRLNVVTIHLPPLRERPGDIALLVQGLLPGIEAEVGRHAVLTPGAMEALEAWHWPGNVRELENELRRAVALSDGEIHRADLSPRIA